jgi:hypothetical protein
VNKLSSRPRLITFLAGVFLLLAIMGWLRLEQVVQSWDALNQRLVWPLPLYLAISGVVWGLPGLPAAWGLWFGNRWGRFFAGASGVFYPGLYWLDALIFRRSPERWVNWLFAVVATVIWLAFILVVLSRRSSRSYLTGS